MRAPSDVNCPEIHNWPVQAEIEQPDTRGLLKTIRCLQVQLLTLQKARRHALQADAGAERIFLLKFSRHPREFYEALSQGPPLELRPQALQQADRSWELSCSGKVFVPAHHFDETVDLLNNQNVCKQHVIASESLFQSAVSSVCNLRSRLRGHLKAQRDLGVVVIFVLLIFVVILFIFLSLLLPFLGGTPGHPGARGARNVAASGACRGWRQFFWKIGNCKHFA